MKFSTMSYNLFSFAMVMVFPSFTFASWTTNNPPKRPLDDNSRTCTEWICHHGFTMDDYDANREKAKTRNYKLDKYASTWAAIYAYKIGGIENLSKILPEEFCQSFGTENDKVHPFRTLKNEIETCESWILLYRFKEDDPLYNLAYARNENYINKQEISLWPYSYSVYLVKNGEPFVITPSDFCTKIGKVVGSEAKLMPFMSVKDTELTCSGWMELYEYTDDVDFNYNKALSLLMEEMNNNIRIQYFPEAYATILQNSTYSDILGDYAIPAIQCDKWNAGETKKFGFYYIPLLYYEPSLF